MDWEMLKKSVKLEYSSAAPTTSSHPTLVKDLFEEWMRLDELLTHGEGRRGSAPVTIIVGWKDWYPEPFNLLEYIRSTECSDIHDKVFGILSIVQHGPSHNPIHVDYSISIEKLFLHTLACWSAGFVTVKIANHLMGILSLDVASLASEVQHEQYLNFHAPENEASDSVRLDFLLIRLGIVSEITTASLEFVPASKHPISHITFDGPYSDRLNILGPGWSKERPYPAVGFASCVIAAGDIVYAFMDTTAAVIFRNEEDRLISVGAAVLSDPGEMCTPEAEEQTYYIAQNLLHSSFLEAGTPPPFELDCTAALEINTDVEPRFAVSKLACHSGKYDWPPLRSKLSQRHVRQFI